VHPICKRLERASYSLLFAVVSSSWETAEDHGNRGDNRKVFLRR
jgi:hypothetical protein